MARQTSFVLGKGEIAILCLFKKSTHLSEEEITRSIGIAVFRGGRPSFKRSIQKLKNYKLLDIDGEMFKLTVFGKCIKSVLMENNFCKH